MMAAMVGCFVVLIGGMVHHSHHLRPSSAEEAPQEQRRDGEEDDIEDGRVIPADVLLHHTRSAVGWNQVQCSEEKLDGK